MTEQSKLIGKHPTGGLFDKWCCCEDTLSSKTKKHRKLTNKEIDGIDRVVLIDQLAELIIKHHTSPLALERLEKRKLILEKHQFNKYVKDRMPFPVSNAKTQKGNLGEIILSEYLKSSSRLELLIYKLQFNPNIEQSMKGDDVLLFDKDNIKNKIIMGEAKFRATPDKEVIKDIINALSKDNLPISLTFVSNMLAEKGELDLSDQVDDLISKVHSSELNIIYVGFLHSNKNAANNVERNLNSDNKNLIVISYGEDNPNDLIKRSYEKAVERIGN